MARPGDKRLVKRRKVKPRTRAATHGIPVYPAAHTLCTTRVTCKSCHKKKDLLPDLAMRLATWRTQQVGPDPDKVRFQIIWIGLVMRAKAGGGDIECGDCMELPPTSDFNQAQEIHNIPMSRLNAKRVYSGMVDSPLPPSACSELHNWNSNQ